MAFSFFAVFNYEVHFGMHAGTDVRPLERPSWRTKEKNGGGTAMCSRCGGRRVVSLQAAAPPETWRIWPAAIR